MPAGARLPAVRSVDVAPTVLSLLGVPVPEWMEGAPIAAFEAGVDVPAGWPSNRWETWSPFSLPFNLSQQPAITVPCGTTPTGLPVGLQIVAAKHRDDLVLRTARAYEAARSDGASTFVRPLGTV